MQEKREGGVRGWRQLLVWLQRGHLQHPVQGSGDWGRVRGAWQHAALHELRPHRDGRDGLLYRSVAQGSYLESSKRTKVFFKIYCCTHTYGYNISFLLRLYKYFIHSEKCPDCGRIPPGRRKKPKERFKRFRKLSTRKNGQKLRQQQQVSNVRNIQFY